MDTLTIGDIITYVVPVATLGLGYWLLKVRDRLLILENNYEHLKDAVEGVQADIEQIKEDMSEVRRSMGELISALKAKGVVNGNVKPPQ